MITLYFLDVQVKDEGEMRKLQELHNIVYNQACSWFQSLRNKFHSQILQYFGPMPEKEENLQVLSDYSIGQLFA